MCDEGNLELGKYPIPRMTVVVVFKIIGNKPITYENVYHMRKWALLSQIQVKYIKDIIVTRDMANPGISSKDLIQVISEIGQTNYFVLAENQLDCLIQEEWLPNMNRHG